MNKIWVGYYGKMKMEAEVGEDRIKIRVFRTPMLSTENEKAVQRARNFYRRNR